MSSDLSQPRTVLIVDDDPVARMFVTHALSEMGIGCIEAVDGMEALAKLDAALPDLVILDLEMPGIDGFETCSRIRAAERTRELPVLIATGYTDGETIDRAYDVGATDFLKKPIDFSVLRHHVRFLMRANDACAELKLPLGVLEARDRRLEGAQRLAHLGNWEWQPESNEMLWSSETFRVLGLAPHSIESTAEAFLEAVHPEDREAVWKLFRSSNLEHESWSLDHRIMTRQGQTRVVQQHATVSNDGTGFCVSGTIQDITERRRAEDQIEFLAHFDGLTALPNRKLLCERMDRLLARASHAEENLGVVRLDLDRFGRINDTLGQEVGDHLLRSVARRLQSCVRTTDLVAHAEHAEESAVSSMGGDEFSILLTQVHSSEDLARVSRRILECFERPFTAHGHQIEMRASLGVAMFPNDGDTTERLLRSSGSAMGHAKREGGSAFRFFDASMNERAERQMQIEMGLRAALERCELRLAYQPKWDADTRKVVGMEALVRWHSPELGDVSPGEFIPVAESANLVTRLGEWVFEEACRQMWTWKSEGLEPVPMAVNFSSKQLHTAAVAKLVTRVMHNFEIEPHMVEIEMTESALVGDVDEVMEVLGALKATGVRIALDDFGTGFSSISHLARFPIDVLKIDQSFVSRIGEDEQIATLVSALIGMARRLSLTVVAEGVETDDQAAFVTGEGCDILQGYWLARPLEVSSRAAAPTLSSATASRSRNATGAVL
jgi:diguanylate cyclase (GGDEF)-like protein/PAS domain S-box-containing protein